MTNLSPNPYQSLPATAYWRTGVAEPGLEGLTGLWASPWTLPADAKFATFGSCFAQHISRALRSRDMGWVDGEPAPSGMLPKMAAQFNYGVFSARTANIYSAAQFRLLLSLAVADMAADVPEIWQDGTCWRDSLRPMIEPDGFVSHTEALASRVSMLRGFARAISKADVVVFTLGLTEGWESIETGLPYALCPGTQGGTFDPARHRFVNYRAAAIRADLDASLDLIHRLNPDARLLLTVSPVPLTATASSQHVLVATTRSKSVLRGVAAEMAEDSDHVDYFPSYEVITGAPTAARFWEDNMRSVRPEGVATVMGHFFAGLNLTGAPRALPTEDALVAHRKAAAKAAIAHEELACEEAMLEAYNAS
ncbi:MAG: GSCFA domain-containing protein [Paracoccaceae bacterium]